MDSRSYIKLTGNLTNVTGTTGSTGTTNITLAQPLKTCYINIGAWDMAHPNRGHSTAIPSSIAINKIRSFDATIFSNGGDIYPFAFADWSPSGRIHANVASCCLDLERDDGGFFTQSAFYGSSVNRGRVAITYSNIKPPSGTTGIAANVLATSMNVNANVITNAGNDTICEYGVVYSQATSTPTISNGKVCTTGEITIGAPYNKSISGLADATTTYFRAYAKNSEEVGYGVVCSQLMPAAPPATDVNVCLNICNAYGQYADGYIDVLETLATGQYVTVQVTTMQTAENNGDSAGFRIYSASTVGGYFYEIYPISPNPQINYYCSNAYGVGCINIYKNSCICWCNAVQSGGGYNPLCSQFVINAIGGSVGIIPHTQYPYMNCVPV
jgi:hypothetical protein